MRCLVTGAGGFIGGHLLELLAERSCEIHAVDPFESPVFASLRNLRFRQIDLLDADSLSQCIAEARPDVIYHLAAQSYPGVSWEKPAETFRVNVMGTVNLLEAVRRAELDPVILVVCSSAEYAIEAGAKPISEDVLLRPSSPYGISKLAQDSVARLYHAKYGMRTIRLRPFFLIGPRKRGDVCSDFAQGIVAIERKQQEFLSVGNLEVVRDMLDVRDGVEAFWTLAERGAAGDVYNICSGQGYSIREILERLKASARVPVREQVDPARMRPIEEMVRIGDPQKLRELGWLPKRSVDETLRDILEYWRTQTTS